MTLKPPPSAALKAASRLQKLRARNTTDQQHHVKGEGCKQRGCEALYSLWCTALRSVHKHDITMPRWRYVYKQSCSRAPVFISMNSCESTIGALRVSALVPAVPPSAPIATMKACSKSPQAAHPPPASGGFTCTMRNAASKHTLLRHCRR